MKRTKALVGMSAMILALALLALLGACGSSETTSSGASGDRTGRSGDMTTAFRQALDTLVDQGTITSDQEEAVLTAITTGRPGGGQGDTPPSAGPMAQGSPPAQSGGQQSNRPDRGGMISSALDDLVDAGTITAAQEEAVLTALSAAMPQPGSAPGA